MKTKQKLIELINTMSVNLVDDDLWEFVIHLSNFTTDGDFKYRLQEYDILQEYIKRFKRGGE